MPIIQAWLQMLMELSHYRHSNLYSPHKRQLLPLFNAASSYYY